jgi:hypothetical protein
MATTGVDRRADPLRVRVVGRHAFFEAALGALLVPGEAVVRRHGRPVVFVRDGGRGRLVDASGGLADGRDQQVPGGVGPGDRVVVEGQADLEDGDAVASRADDEGGAVP